MPSVMKRAGSISEKSVWTANALQTGSQGRRLNALSLHIALRAIACAGLIQKAASLWGKPFRPGRGGRNGIETLTFDVDGVSTVVRQLARDGSDSASWGGYARGPSMGTGAGRPVSGVSAVHPGFGESGAAPYVRDMQDLVIDYSTCCGIKVDRPHLVGHSMGGWMASEIAAVAGEPSIDWCSSHRPASITLITRWQIALISRRRNFPDTSRITSMLRSNIFRAAPKAVPEDLAPRVNARMKR